MGGDAAHRVHRDGAADHFVLSAAGPICPFDVEDDFLVEGGLGQFGGDTADMVRRYTGSQRSGFRAVIGVHVSVGHQLEGGDGGAAVIQRYFADHFRRDAGEACVGNLAGVVVPAQRLAVRPAGEQPVIRRPRVPYHQPWRVGVTHQVIEIDLVGVQQFVDQRHDERAVGAGFDTDPFVGDGGIARLHRVDGHELRAALLQCRQPHLDGV